MADIGTAYVKVAPNMTGIQGKIASGLRGSGSQFAKQFGSEISGKSAVVIGAIAGVAQAAVSKAMNLVTDSIGSAIKRVDTLNNAERTFKFMGFAADDARKATAALNKSIKGLPTPLDSAMRGMTALAATYQDIGLGQKVFSSLNNAILGFGGSAEMVEGAITQLSQLPLDGPLDAQTWNSLRNSGLTPLFVAMAKESNMSVSEMKTAFGEGELTVQDFTDKLLEMNTKGGGGLASLETIAKSATSGIGTGIANMQTAVSRGLANIIQAIGASNIAGTIGKIGDAFEKALNVIAQNVPKAVSALQTFSEFVVRNKDVISSVAVGLGTAVVAYKTYNTIVKISTSITQAYTKATLLLNLVQSLQAQGLGKLRAAWLAVNLSMAANPIGLIIVAVAALTAGLVYFFTRTETGRKIFSKFAEGVKTAISGILTFLRPAGTFFVAVFNNIRKGIDLLRSAIGYLVGFWRPHFEGLVAVFQGVWLAFDTMQKSIRAVIEPLVSIIRDQLIGAFIELKNTLVEQIKPVIEEFKRLWRETFAPAFEEFKRIWHSTLKPALVEFQKEFDKVWQKIRGPVLTALKILGVIIAVIVAGPLLLLIGTIVAIIVVFSAIVYAIMKVVNWFIKLRGAVRQAMAVFSNTVQKGTIDVIMFFVGLPGRIRSALGNLGKLLYQKGRDLVTGLMDGAGSLLPQIGRFFLDKLPGWIRGPFEKALGISSPSKVFAAYGKNIDEGLAQGVSKNTQIVNRSVSEMVNATVSPFTSPLMNPRVAFGASGGLTPTGQAGNNTNQTVTIQQVVLGDESAVKEFFKQLNQDTINTGMGLTPVQGANR